ncbi:MAG TPA: ATP-binding protein, partial [Candidatus Binatia bacterium]|nr:ATP-binding protein [Candidatus Binatia bacterium]
GTTSAAKDPFLLGFGAVVVAVGAGLVIPTLQQRLETRVQRALFRDRWDSRRRLQDLTAKLVHILDRGELVKYLGDALVEILEPKVCEILLVDDRSRRVGVAYPAVGAPPTPDCAADALHAVTEPVLSAELEPSGALARLFACRGWELGVPLRVRNDAIGLVGLGANRDLRIYSAEDIELLARVAAAASVALENAKLSRLLRQSEAGLERANKLSSVGQLAAGIAHEIRNPLVAVKTFLDLLPEHIEDRAFVDHFRELSLSELKRVTTLISDLLTLGKSTQIKRCQVALLPTLQPVVRLMESNAQKRDVRLTYAADPQLPELWGDPDELKQIVLNLLLNAIEASPPDAEVRLSVEVGDDAGETVVIEVQDEGPGIPKESFEDIFHPFFTTKETGTGLGLALVHQMVIEHAGTIEVESAPGRGAVFRVTLPAMAVEPNAVDRRVARTGT